MSSESLATRPVAVVTSWSEASDFEYLTFWRGRFRRTFSISSCNFQTERMPIGEHLRLMLPRVNFLALTGWLRTNAVAAPQQSSAVRIFACQEVWVDEASSPPRGFFDED